MLNNKKIQFISSSIYFSKNRLTFRNIPQLNIVLRQYRQVAQSQQQLNRIETVSIHVFTSLIMQNSIPTNRIMIETFVVDFKRNIAKQLNS